MGRHPSNGLPSFRFTSTEAFLAKHVRDPIDQIGFTDLETLLLLCVDIHDVAEMKAILQAHNTQLPAREVLVAIAEKFSNSAERSGNIVQMKQVWNWFQNRRYALRAEAGSVGKAPGKLVVPMPQNDSTARSVPEAPQLLTSSTVQNADRNVSDNTKMEFEARSARDGAWYDVASFLSQRLECGDLEVLVCFAGLGGEEDEWVNVRRDVRQRSLPCEPSECVAVLPGDLILCFQDGKDQALYFDAHVLDAQRRRHDARGCRCRFLVRYVHGQFEEIVPLRKVCRRPETDYRLQQLCAESARVNQQRTRADIQTSNPVSAYPTVNTEQKQINAGAVAGARAVATNVTQLNNQLKNCIDSCAGQPVKVNRHAETSQTHHNNAETCADDKTIATPLNQTSLPVSIDSNILPAKNSKTDTACHANVSATREPNVLPPNATVSGANGRNNFPVSCETTSSPAQTAKSGTITDPDIANDPASNAAVTGGAATTLPLAAPAETQRQE